MRVPPSTSRRYPSPIPCTEEGKDGLMGRELLEKREFTKEYSKVKCLTEYKESNYYCNVSSCDNYRRATPRGESLFAVSFMTTVLIGCILLYFFVFREKEGIEHEDNDVSFVVKFIVIIIGSLFASFPIYLIFSALYEVQKSFSILSLFI